jgi:hypothetical protein
MGTLLVPSEPKSGRFETQVAADRGKIISSSKKPNHRSMFGFILWPIYKSPLEKKYINFLSSSITMMVSQVQI